MEQQEFIVTDHTEMWFGAHRGTKMANVPEGWLWWWYNNQDRDKLNYRTRALIKYIDDNMDLIVQGSIINRR